MYCTCTCPEGLSSRLVPLGDDLWNMRLPQYSSFTKLQRESIYDRKKTDKIYFKYGFENWIIGNSYAFQYSLIN